VGGKAQPAAYRSIISDLKLAYAQYEELESFIRYGARLDEASHRAIEYGRRIQACLKQEETDPFSLEEQVLILSALTERQLDLIPVDQMPDAQIALRRAVSRIEPDLLAKLSGDKPLGEVDTMTLKRLTQETLARFSTSSETSQ
jgi:F-type H+-transporting ATPase subunit alpha